MPKCEKHWSCRVDPLNIRLKLRIRVEIFSAIYRIEQCWHDSCLLYSVSKRFQKTLFQKSVTFYMEREGVFEFMELLDFFAAHWGPLLQMTWEHIVLVGLAVGFALLTGVPFGIYISQRESLANLVLAVAGIIMTVPSIALFGIMIPILSLINRGIGFLPAFIALVLYSQLPIIRNTYIAIKNVDPNLRDAATGMGMTPWQRLYKLEIPLAVPVIMAGVRVAVVLTIGIGAIAAYIGAGGLGYYISRGISTSYTVMVQAGAISVSVLAVIADFGLARLQKKWTQIRIKTS